MSHSHFLLVRAEEPDRLHVEVDGDLAVVVLVVELDPHLELEAVGGLKF